MAKNYNKPVIVGVKISAVLQALTYGFRSKLAEGSQGDFGQVAITSASLEGFIFGANAPKPCRASKKTVEGTIGSFCDYTKIAALRTEGYSIKYSQIRLPNVSSLSSTQYVLINGVKYAWNLPNATTVVGLSAIGAITPEPGETDLVFGASFPKPPKASTIAEGHSFTTFYNPSEALPTGWEARFGKARYTAVHLAALVGS